MKKYSKESAKGRRSAHKEDADTKYMHCSVIDHGKTCTDNERNNRRGRGRGQTRGGLGF